MKISDVCRQYGFDENDLKAFLKEKKLLKETWTSYVIEDSNVDKAVRMYAEFKAQQEEEAAAERREAEKKKRAMAKMLITSGFSFDGYTITKYSGYISGDDAISVDRGLAVFGSDTGVKDKLLNSLVEIRRNALRELKEAAYELGLYHARSADEGLARNGGNIVPAIRFCGHRQRQRGRNRKKR